MLKSVLATIGCLGFISLTQAADQARPSKLMD